MRTRQVSKLRAVLCGASHDRAVQEMDDDAVSALFHHSSFVIRHCHRYHPITAGGLTDQNPMPVETRGVPRLRLDSDAAVDCLPAPFLAGTAGEQNEKADAQ